MVKREDPNPPFKKRSGIGYIDSWKHTSCDAWKQAVIQMARSPRKPPPFPSPSPSPSPLLHVFLSNFSLLLSISPASYFRSHFCRFPSRLFLLFPHFRNRSRFPLLFVFSACMVLDLGCRMSAPDGLATKLLYLVVLEDDAADAPPGKETPSFRYSRSVLQSTLQLIGCKPRHSFKVVSVF